MFPLTYSRISWRRKWQPTPVFLPGKSHGQRSLAGYSPRGRRESDTIERMRIHALSSVQSLDCVWLFATPWTAAHQASLPITNSQTHVHWVSDAIQPSHPLSSPSPPALNLSQHQGLFQWVSFSHQVAKVLEFQLQHQSLQWTHRTDLL